jgi:predicted nucleotidyltransferase
MFTLEEIKDKLQKSKSYFQNKYGVSGMAIFGSFSRNQQTEQSDIDILVEFSRPIGMEFMELADELEEIVQLKVDLVSKNGLKNHHFKAIQQELSYV